MPQPYDENKKQYMREYYQRNRQRLIDEMKKRYAENRDEIRAKERAKFKADPDKWRPIFKAQKLAWESKHPGYHRDLRRRRYAEIKSLLLDAYGGKCECCGESIVEFLTLDHINGDGKIERLKFGNRLYAKVAKEGFPKDRYRLLCFNCNWACRGGRICPHQQRDGVLITAC